MDELTDEEGAPEEDLRATLNKNKTKTVVVKKQVDQKRRLIRKINVMVSVFKLINLKFKKYF